MIDKFTQKEINSFATSILNDALNQEYAKRERLFSCQAYVTENDTYIVLVSYRTPIAVYDKRNNTIYDCLRTEYGYTATSAQHVARFRNWLRWNGKTKAFSDYPTFYRTYPV